MARLYGAPFVPFKVAATARVKDPANGLYGSGTLVGSVAVPASRRIRSVHDGAASGAADVWLVWGAKTATPDGDQSSRFNDAGAGVVMPFTAHVYSTLRETTDEADEVCSALVRLFHHQPLVMEGWRTDRVDCAVIDVVPDPVGHHGILQFRVLARVVP